jgi:hypothetical protein
MTGQHGLWEPAPDGPPPVIGNRRGKFNDLRVWCKEHPGEWAVIRNQNRGNGTHFKRQGFEVRSKVVEPNSLIVDIYIRWPAEP